MAPSAGILCRAYSAGARARPPTPPQAPELWEAPAFASPSLPRGVAQVGGLGVVGCGVGSGSSNLGRPRLPAPHSRAAWRRWVVWGLLVVGLVLAQVTWGGRFVAPHAHTHTRTHTCTHTHMHTHTHVRTSVIFFRAKPTLSTGPGLGHSANTCFDT